MRFKILCLGLLLFVVTLSSVVVYSETKKDAIVFRRYPYSADQARRDKILNSYKDIKADMDVVEVIVLLGHPDEIRYLYEPKKFNAQQIGYTYWYILNRGNYIKNKYEDEHLVRISLNLDLKVLTIDSW